MVWNRTGKTRGCLSHKTALVMVYKRMMLAKKNWHRLSGSQPITKIIEGVEFLDGIKQLKETGQKARHKLQSKTPVSTVATMQIDVTETEPNHKLVVFAIVGMSHSLLKLIRVALLDIGLTRPLCVGQDRGVRFAGV